MRDSQRVKGYTGETIIILKESKPGKEGNKGQWKDGWGRWAESSEAWQLENTHSRAQALLMPAPSSIVKSKLHSALYLSSPFPSKMS